MPYNDFILIFLFSDNSSNNEMMNHGKPSAETNDAASRFLAMQRNILNSDLLKQLQLGNAGSEGILHAIHANSFNQANNPSSLGLAGLAAAAGLSGLPLSSGGLSSPMNNSVPTIAALLAASQEKIAADLRQNINGLEKEHDSQDREQPKDYFEMNDDSIRRFNELKNLKRSISSFPTLNDKDGCDDELHVDHSKSRLSTSPLNSRDQASPHESQRHLMSSSNSSKSKYIKYSYTN